MEAWDCFSPLGAARPFRLRGTALFVLSAGFLDTGRRSQRGLSVDSGLPNLYLGGADAGGPVHVRAGPTLVRSPRYALRSGALRGQSISSRDRLLAQRLC